MWLDECACVLSPCSRVWLLVTPWIVTRQARILEWVAISSSRGSFPTQGSNPCHLRLLHWQVVFFFFFIFKTSATWEALVGWITVPKDIPSYPQILSICLSFCIAEGTLQMWSSQTCWVEEMMLDYLGGAGALTWGRQGDQGQGGPQTKKVEVRVRLGQDGGCEPAMPGPWELETLRKWSLQMQSCWYLDFSW